MPQYKAPLRDMQFVLHELLNAEQHYATLPAFQESVSRELVDQYLEAAADFCENELSPLNQFAANAFLECRKSCIMLFSV